MTSVLGINRHAAAIAAGFAEPWLHLRERVLRSARFRAWASNCVLTRWVARRQARRLFDLSAGFVYSQVLSACVELRVIDLLADDPKSPKDLAPMLGLSADATERLLGAATALALTEKRSHGRYGVGSMGAALLENPGVTAMVRHHRMLYQDLLDPVQLLRGQLQGTLLRKYWPYAASEHLSTPFSREDVSAYTQLMAESQSMVAAEVLRACRFDDFQTVLDIGGGSGGFLIALAQHYPQLQLMLFDLPAVAALAEERLSQAGLRARSRIICGNFHTDPLPQGADLVTLIRILHDHDDEQVLALLRAVRASIRDGGTLLVVEPMSETSGAETVGDAYFGMYLLAMGSGRARTIERLQEMLHSVGFSMCHEVRTTLPLLTRIITARVKSS